ncbi:MAG TPA: hypothetical protein VL086_05855 [Candidatus Nitrosotalea sp.]|nr:hypothetical protein [Candidatus Nitrosotalea sp.]
MQVTRTTIAESPLGPHRVRLSGHVRYDKGPVPSETYWFDVPVEYGDSLSRSGNPWLVCLAPLAATVGERLQIDDPVDPLLLKNVRGLVKLWKNWYPSLHLIPIEAPNVAPAEAAGPRRTGAFFSGGVDAFFTVLRHHQPTHSWDHIPIDDLIFVWGFDVPIDKPDAFDRTRHAMQSVAKELGKNLVLVATNLKTTRLENDAEWGPLWHGSGIVSTGLALEKRYDRLVIASTYSYLNLAPWGSHPFSDPLLSTLGTRVIHDDASFSRTEKTELVARSDMALRTLRVCWNTRSEQNCSNCNKCFRTMATLEVLGALERCPQFDRKRLTLDALSRLFSGDHNDVILLLEVRDLALQQGRGDIADAIDRSLARSRRMRKWVALALWLGRRPYVWRWERPLLRRLRLVY